MNIHFICRGNVLRSIIAETYLRSLNLPDVTVSSSGTVAAYENQAELDGFAAATRALLIAHGLAEYAKPKRQQLSNASIQPGSVVVCVNQRAYDEATQLVALPEATRIWDIVDIGEGDRIVSGNDRSEYEEIIFKEVVAHVDKLVGEL